MECGRAGETAAEERTLGTLTGPPCASLMPSLGPCSLDAIICSLLQCSRGVHCQPATQQPCRTWRRSCRVRCRPARRRLQLSPPAALQPPSSSAALMLPATALAASALTAQSRRRLCRCLPLSHRPPAALPPSSPPPRIRRPHPGAAASPRLAAACAHRAPLHARLPPDARAGELQLHEPHASPCGSSLQLPEAAARRSPAVACCCRRRFAACIALPLF